jgi:hypothetical protein
MASLPWRVVGSITFKEDVLEAFYNGIKHKPDTTFGNVKPDVIADKEPGFRKGYSCSVIRASRWPGATYTPGCGCGQHN